MDIKEDMLRQLGEMMKKAIREERLEHMDQKAPEDSRRLQKAPEGFRRLWKITPKLLGSFSICVVIREDWD